MYKTEKTEIIVDLFVGVCFVALAVFIANYELYAMAKYSDGLAQAGRAGMGVAAILLYIFVYLPTAAFSAVVAILLFCLSFGLYRANKKKKTVGFIEVRDEIAKEKNRNLITTIVFKAIGTVVSAFLAVLAFQTAHETLLSKTVYTAATVISVASLVFTIINRKKIVENAKRLQ